MSAHVGFCICDTVFAIIQTRPPGPLHCQELEKRFEFYDKPLCVRPQKRASA